eukprot:gnl/MRDRNA2_/MRDRNA2_93991_c0_seq1.p1 gnl/MRDRNA2_/MRDRNA2_93991_c0~~gnl/MRDRNA2_/MRDRNA2_93991_c0_seq1.p1  ORF type:complete len:177 (+),score=27.48 gnl/MRDRNA2_/MRDRNA2_93991_c0_seq1:125-655(+)
MSPPVTEADIDMQWCKAKEFCNRRVVRRPTSTEEENLRQRVTSRASAETLMQNMRTWEAWSAPDKENAPIAGDQTLARLKSRDLDGTNLSSHGQRVLWSPPIDKQSGSMQGFESQSERVRSKLDRIYQKICVDFTDLQERLDDMWTERNKNRSARIQPSSLGVQGIPARGTLMDVN